MNLNKWLLENLSRGLVKINLHKFYPIKKNTNESAQLKVVFFCGATGFSYLNASLISIYKTWEKIPEIYIISDGSSLSKMQEKLIKWPNKVEIQSWELFANYFKENGNPNLYNYAKNTIFGRKLVGILYYAKKFPILYSDTDVLWFNSPLQKNFNFGVKPNIIMGQDIGYYYDIPLINFVSEQKCLNTSPLNSGLIYLDGDFSSYPKWELLCKTLGTYKKEEGKYEGFPEQTTFAILNNHFNPNNFFKEDEILIKIDDEFGFRHTRNLYPKILARHYVSVKGTAFWRDFLYIAFQRKSKSNIQAVSKQKNI